MFTVGAMIALALFAAAAQSTPTAPPARIERASATVSVRILQAARVEQGRTAEPHSRGTARVAEADGSRRAIPLVEFQ